MKRKIDHEFYRDFFIERPVFSWVLSLMLLLFGLMSYNQLTVRQFPEISTTTISVMTSYPGASAELMEGFVTSPSKVPLPVLTALTNTSSNSKGRIEHYYQL